MKRGFHTRLEMIARIIRKEKRIDKVRLVLLSDISPSTLYNYIPYLLQRYDDIVYNDGIFEALEVTDLESRVE